MTECAVVMPLGDEPGKVTGPGVTSPETCDCLCADHLGDGESRASEFLFRSVGRSRIGNEIWSRSGIGGSSARWEEGFASDLRSVPSAQPLRSPLRCLPSTVRRQASPGPFPRRTRSTPPRREARCWSAIGLSRKRPINFCSSRLVRASCPRERRARHFAFGFAAWPATRSP